LATGPPGCSSDQFWALLSVELVRILSAFGEKAELNSVRVPRPGRRVDLSSGAEDVARRIVEIILDVMAQEELRARGGALAQLLFDSPQVLAEECRLPKNVLLSTRSFFSKNAREYN
jgi:hypothetical protein